MNEIPLALAAVGYSDGMRVFIHPGDDNARVIGNEAEVADILARRHSEIARKGKWEPGTLRAFCDTQSNLAAFEGQNGLILGLFCQQHNDTLRLYRRDYKWRHVTDFQKARPGTALAAVSSSLADKVVLFFQDEHNYVCCLRGSSQEMDWKWDSTVRLGEGTPGCGIAATSWKRKKGLEEIGLYYQDARLQTVELRLGFSDCQSSIVATHQPIPLREAIPEPISMQVLAAVSWGSAPHIKVYLRENSNIWEFKQLLPAGTKRRWERKLITCSNISPLSSLAVVARTARSSDDVVIDILYWSANKTLNHMLFVPRGGWHETKSIRPPPAIKPPRHTDPYDVAFSGNAIRLEAVSDLLGVRDALWTLCHHVVWLKKEVQDAPSHADLLRNVANITLNMSEEAETSKPPKYVQYLTDLGPLVVNLFEKSENGDKYGRDDLLHQCKVQAARVEVAVECWPGMCAALHNNMKLVTLDIEDLLRGIEASEARLNDINEVISSTVAHGKEQKSEKRNFDSQFGAALVAAGSNALELDKLRSVVQLNSRKASQLRPKSRAWKTRAHDIDKRFSAFRDHSRTLPLQDSAQDFATVIIAMLDELDGLDGVIETHVRAFGGLKRQLQAIAT